MIIEQYEKEHLRALRPHLAKCTVLLKKNGDFPLEAPCPVALYGSGARKTLKGGTGSGEVNSRFYVNVETGLEKRGFTVTTKGWLDEYDRISAEAHEAFRSKIRKDAKAHHVPAVIEGMGAVMPEPEYSLPLNGEGDTAVYVLSRICGEGNDRQMEAGDVFLTDTEIRDILACAENYSRFMLVLNTGGPVDLTPVLSVPNILILSQLGVDTGLVLAGILLGKMVPSGKLSTTWTTPEDYPIIGDFGDINDTRYREGIYVGYRYFDSVAKKVLFPFGYGLSWTEFELSCGIPSAEGEEISVPVTVKNTGSSPGQEVVQLYVSVPEGRLDQPFQMLAGWRRTGTIKPGESETVTIRFALSELASYDTENARYVLEEGDYILRTGADSRRTAVAGIVQLTGEAVVMQTENALGTPDFTDWKPRWPFSNRTTDASPLCSDNSPTTDASPLCSEDAPKKYDASPCVCENEKINDEPADQGKDLRYGDIPRLQVRPEDIEERKAGLQPEDIPQEIKALTDEELCYMNTGAFNPKGGLMSIVGTASSSVAGAAGETSTKAKDIFPVPLVMADGPAGLRLSRRYAKTKKGIKNLGLVFPESMLELLPAPAVFFLEKMRYRPRKGDVICGQYATALPIGTAVAQSWDPLFAEICGDIVGDEMVRFGVNLWLAPALNIHRNILCGRNFEYYSEDPLLSGRIAAGITRGVQKHPGRSVVIKHFAANNQEQNRYNNNSQVSERAMREIYLKGFARCIREAHPYALMSSYNLLNGIHTSERYDLTETVLRGEMGFDGVVMTDWLVAGMMNKASKHPAAAAGAIAAAGESLIMPGSKKDVEALLAALADGSLTRGDLERNATRLLGLYRKLV